jgi:hypothetical protein
MPKTSKSRKRTPKSGQPYQYWVTGSQYYALGRQAVHCGYVPAAGNLFHHGIELMMKYRLLDKFSQTTLANKPYGHSLLPLWREFKALVRDATLAQFDSLVRRVNKWEEIRYPGFPRASLGMSIDIRKAHKTTFHPMRGRIDVYRVNLEEMDELFAALVTACSLNPVLVRQRIASRPVGRETYEKENYHLI